MSMSDHISLLCEPHRDGTNTEVVFSEVGDQPVRLPSLSMGFTAHSKKDWVLSDPVGEQL